MRALPLVFASALLACAGPVAPGFDGTWVGSSTVEFAERSPLTFPAQIEAHLSGDGAALLHICPNGDGELTVRDDNGSPGTATWKGSLVCSPVATSDCASVQFTYWLAWANLTERMAVRISGDADGCGKDTALSLLFTGSK